LQTEAVHTVIARSEATWQSRGTKTNSVSSHLDCFS